MKKLASILTLLLTSVFISPAIAGGEMKEVCEVQKDKAGNVVKNKDGSEKQVCKKIKVHKKVEGEKVPDAKK